MIASRPRAPLALLAVLTLCGGSSAFATTPSEGAWTLVPDPSGGTVRDIRPSPHEVGVLMAALTNGVYRSVDSGATWVGPLPGTEGFGANRVDFHPTDPEVLLAVSSSGGMRSMDGGDHWTRFGFSGLHIFEEGKAVAFDPEQAGRAWAIVERFSPSRSDLYLSNDGGRGWQRMASLEFGGYDRILVVPATGDVLLAGPYGLGLSADGGVTVDRVLDSSISSVVASPLLFAIGPGTLWQSLDAGRTWNALRPPPDTATTRVLAVRSSQPPQLLVASEDGGHWHTTDGGEHWRPMPGLPKSVAVDALVTADWAPGEVWAGSSNGLGIWRSTNTGADWQQASEGLIPIVVRVRTHPDPGAPTYAVTRGGGLFESRDAGESWRPVLELSGRSPRVRDVRYQASNPDRLLAVDAATTGTRLLSSTNAGLDWTVIDTPFDTFYQRAVLGAAGNLYVSSLGDEAVASSFDGGASWNVVPVDDPFDLIADPRAPGWAHVIGGLVLWRTRDGGQSWTQSNLGGPRDLALGRSGSRDMHAVRGNAHGNSGYYRSQDGGTSWTEGANGLPAIGVNLVGVDVAHPGRVFVGKRSRGEVFLSADGGESFRALPPGPPEMAAAQVLAPPAGISEVWVLGLDGRIRRFRL